MIRIGSMYEITYRVETKTRVKINVFLPIFLSTGEQVQFIASLYTQKA